MHSKDLRGSGMLVIGDSNEVLVADQNEQRGETRGSVGGPKPSKPTGAESGFGTGARNGSGGKEFPRGAEEFGSAAQLGRAFGTSEVMFFVGIAFGRGELAQKILLAS